MEQAWQAARVEVQQQADAEAARRETQARKDLADDVVDTLLERTDVQSST